MRDQKLSGKDPVEQSAKGDQNTAPKSDVDNSYLQSQLLIAMPGLDDPYFKQSVTLICQHSEDGCFGLTINKPIEITVDEVLKQLDIESELPISSNAEIKQAKLNVSTSKISSIKPFFNKPLPALRGGPVQTEQGFVIHDSSSHWENTMVVCDGLSVTVSKDILLDIAAGTGPENYLFVLGCASWEAGQVEGEIMDNSWLNCPIDKKILFDMPFAQRWQGAANTLGVNLSAMSGISGHD